MKNFKKYVVALFGMLCVFSAARGMAQETKLMIWSHWAKEPVKINFMNAAAQEFEKQTGVKIEVVWMEKKDLLEKLPFALEGAEPDMSYIDLGFTQPRIAGNLSDLNDLKIPDQADPTWSIVGVGEGKKNFLPIEGISSGIYYNKDLFAQAKIELPQGRTVTSGEFVEMIKKLRAAGIQPITVGTSDRNGIIGIPIVMAIFRFAGPEKLGQLMKGEINFSDPDVIAGLTFWKQVVDAQGYDVQKALSLTLIDGIYELTDGKGAINFGGTWIYSKFGTTERDKHQVGVIDWFTVENGKGNTSYEINWGAGYGINKNSQHVPEAKKFLEFLMTPVAASLWVTHVQGPYPFMTADSIASESLYGALAATRQGQQRVNQYLSSINFGTKAANNMWEEACRKFIAGNYAVDDFVADMNSRLSVK